MKNTLIKTSLVAAMIAGLAACSAVTPPNQSGMTTARNAAIGAAVGAAAGNLWGKDTEATLTGADINARSFTFETPFTFTSYGERIVGGFIPNEQGVIVEVTCTTKGMPNLMQNGRNRKLIARFMDALSGLVQSAPVEVTAS